MVDSQNRLRNKPRPGNVHSARKAASVRTRSDSRAPELSAADALKIIRSGIDETRPATEFDWDKIERLLGDRIQQAPDNAITVDDYCKKFSASREQAKNSLAALVKSGHMETGTFPGRKHNIKTRFWWLKKG